MVHVRCPLWKLECNGTIDENATMVVSSTTTMVTSEVKYDLRIDGSHEYLASNGHFISIFTDSFPLIVAE